MVVHDIFTVMDKDSIETSHPVSTYVEDPREVQQYFDEISYEKGLSVLRMLRGFIGDDYFQTAMRVYSFLLEFMLHRGFSVTTTEKPAISPGLSGS